MHRIGQRSHAGGTAERYRRAIDDAPSVSGNLDHTPALIAKIEVEPAIVGTDAYIDIALGTIEVCARLDHAKRGLHGIGISGARCLVEELARQPTSKTLAAHWPSLKVIVNGYGCKSH